jgi:hypothetical protein
MATTTIKGVKPSRKGNAVILKTSAGDVFLTKEEFAGMPQGCDQVNYEIKDGYFDRDGKEIKYAEGNRNIFDGFPVVTRAELMREKAEIAQEFGLTLSFA